MARNKLRDHVRRHHAQRRDVNKQHAETLDELPLAASTPTPSAVVAGKELLEAVRKLLSPAELYVAEQRCAGKSWAELSAELGKHKDALRMQHARAVRRAARQLGLEP